jgi:hypothetical protein
MIGLGTTISTNQTERGCGPGVIPQDTGAQTSIYTHNTRA